MRFKDKITLITGAASGIGRAAATAFAKEGATVIVSDMNEVGGNETVAQIKANDGQATFIKTNVAKYEEVENLMQLPRSAIRDGDQVLVVDSENRLHYRNVRILRLQHDDVLISEGLQAGELVCISPLQAVVAGMLVNPIIE